MATRATAEWQFVDLFRPPDPTETLLAKLRHYCLPAGDEAIRHIRAVQIKEVGEMRSTPQARWIPFTAEQTIDTTESSYRWNAHLHAGKIVPLTVMDAYEEHHGKLVAKVGPLTTQRVEGPAADKGELQRYLASFLYCPAMLLNNVSLNWSAAGPLTLRVCDRQDPTGSSVDIELTEEGKPLACRADRPRIVGRHAILSPWLGIADEFGEHAGLRVPRRLEVSWLLGDSWFAYYRSVVTDFSVASCT